MLLLNKTHVLTLYSLKALATPRKKADDPHGGRDPEVENH